ncbi:DksA-like zinc-finger protein [Curvibacter phage PCA1]|nr:DksA-like zinc-finger protein [Curvibacter phage PCA1]
MTTERTADDAVWQLAMTKKPEGPAAKGECHYCGEVLDAGLRFCDADCRDAHEAEAVLRRARGLK